VADDIVAFVHCRSAFGTRLDGYASADFVKMMWKRLMFWEDLDSLIAWGVVESRRCPTYEGGLYSYCLVWVSGLRVVGMLVTRIWSTCDCWQEQGTQDSRCGVVILGSSKVKWCHVDANRFKSMQNAQWKCKSLIMKKTYAQLSYMCPTGMKMVRSSFLLEHRHHYYATCQVS
jgi:hypothetical protein